MKALFLSIALLSVLCSTNPVQIVSDNDFLTVTVCYQPKNNTTYRIIWEKAIVKLNGNSMGIIYPDGECKSIQANYDDSIIATFSCYIISNGDTIRTNYWQPFVVGEKDTLWAIP